VETLSGRSSEMQTRLHPFVQDIHDLDMIRFDMIKNDVAVEMKAEQISRHLEPGTSLVRANRQVMKALIQFSEIFVSLSNAPGLLRIPGDNLKALTCGRRQTETGHDQVSDSWSSSAISVSRL